MFPWVKHEMCLCFAASSDVSLRPSADYGPVEIGDVPTMRELTLCLWLKIEGTWLKQGAKGIYLVRYELDSVGNFFEFYLDEASLYSSTPERIALRFAIGGSSKNGYVYFSMFPGAKFLEDFVILCEFKIKCSGPKNTEIRLIMFCGVPAFIC